eukprot:scaffold5611_cov132-Isochrysis_galbana.AAC.13
MSDVAACTAGASRWGDDDDSMIFCSNKRAAIRLRRAVLPNLPASGASAGCGGSARTRIALTGGRRPCKILPAQQMLQVAPVARGPATVMSGRQAISRARQGPAREPNRAPGAAPADTVGAL